MTVNEIGDEGVKNLCDMLEVNKTLVQLDLERKK